MIPARILVEAENYRLVMVSHLCKKIEVSDDALRCVSGHRDQGISVKMHNYGGGGGGVIMCNINTLV